MVSPRKERSGFATTRWTLVRSVGAEDPQRASEALEELCRLYWYPLYAFLRRSGRREEDAADLVQGLFLRLLARGDIGKIAPEGGRFRNWLLTALRNEAAQVERAGRAEKRGGDRSILSLDLRDAEDRYALEPADPALGPEALMLRRWALCTLEEAMRRLREESSERGRERLHRALEPYLAGAVEAGAHERIGAELGVAPGTVKVTLHRLRRRLGELIRETVAETVAGPEEVEAELARLMEALG